MALGEFSCLVEQFPMISSPSAAIMHLPGNSTLLFIKAWIGNTIPGPLPDSSAGRIHVR